MEVFVDGRACTTKEETHLYLKRVLNLPEYYGMNLDALYDCISTMRHVKVYLIHWDVIVESLGEYGHQLLQTLSEAAEENPGFELFMEDELEDDVEI